MIKSVIAIAITPSLNASSRLVSPPPPAALRRIDAMGSPRSSLSDGRQFEIEIRVERQGRQGLLDPPERRSPHDQQATGPIRRQVERFERSFLTEFPHPFPLG